MWSDGLHTTSTYALLKGATLSDTSPAPLLALRYQEMVVRRHIDCIPPRAPLPRNGSPQPQQQLEDLRAQLYAQAEYYEA